jgi:hypothetical protein
MLLLLLLLLFDTVNFVFMVARIAGLFVLFNTTAIPPAASVATTLFIIGDPYVRFGSYDLDARQERQYKVYSQC